MILRITALLLLLSTLGYSQTGNIRGFVYDKATGDAVIFASVAIPGTTFGSSTDVNGFFSITRVPAGTYTLSISAIGYETKTFSITIKGGDILTDKYFISKRSININQFDVSAEKEESKTEVQTGVTNVTVEDIKRLPSVGGEPDIAQYMQVIPGVVFTGDQGGQLFIRGGTPVQNKVLMDGMIIYNPFHSIGLFSVFDTDIIRNADVYTGGFGAQYGGRISSVMDITTRDGNRKRLGGKVSANTFTSKLLLEGPIKKLDESSGGSSSFILSAKTCYLPQTSRVLYSYAEQGELPFGFTDLYGKISLASKFGSSLNLFGFNFRDFANFVNISDINWSSFGGGGNFVLIPENTNVKIDGIFAYSSYDISLEEATNPPRSSSIDGFNFAMNFTNYYGTDRLTYGVEAVGFSTLYEFINPFGRRIDKRDYSTEFAGYVRYKLTRGRFVIDPSFRLHYYASLAEVSPEPRLGLKYNLNENIRLKASGGLYAQNLVAINSDRDVVNFFYGFLSGLDDLPRNLNGNEVRTNLQKAQHGIIGVEFDFAKRFTANVEAYYKNFSHLISFNREKLYDDIAQNNDKPERFRKDFIRERGYATGTDFLLKYSSPKVYVWAVYSLLFTERFDDIITYFPTFDRRNNVNILVAYTFGENGRWEISGRWNYGSGFPFTQTAGFFPSVNFQDGINTDYVSANTPNGQNPNLLLGDINTGRLPQYHRMDISLKWKKDISEFRKLEITAGATNIYDRRNIFYIDRFTRERVNQLPILPTISASLTF